MPFSRSFHVVIFGGGASGLALAHALLKANISFTVLEHRPKIVEESGAGLGIWSHNVRVLDQFGIL